jgi:PAS domain-containing protein
MKQPNPQTTLKNAEDQQTIAMITKLILTIVAIYFLLIISSLFASDWKLMVVAGFGIVLQVVPFWLIKRGKVFAGSIIMVVTMLSSLTAFATVGQGIRDIALVTFPVVYIFAGLSFNRAVLRTCIALTIVAVGWLVLGESNGWFIPFETAAKPGWSEFIMAAVVLSFVGMAISLLVQNMRQNLDTAQREITQRKKTEETLAFQAELLEKGLDSVYVHDFEGNFIYVNKAAYETHGYTREELFNMKLSELDDTESAKLIATRMKELIEQGSAIFNVHH